VHPAQGQGEHSLRTDPNHGSLEGYLALSRWCPGDINSLVGCTDRGWRTRSCSLDLNHLLARGEYLDTFAVMGRRGTPGSLDFDGDRELKGGALESA